ncbi:MAG: hypothetical protein U0974_11835 [Gemmatimonadales bacterium]|nr:hypothetical protein [Gemmatimonadales bacterium]MDZ4390406.1 hypothetical protein [Gemmatimonadales bacterium]
MPSTPTTPPALRRTLAHLRVVLHRRLRVPRSRGDRALIHNLLLRILGLLLTLLWIPESLHLPSGLDPFPIGPLSAAHATVWVLGPAVMAVLGLDHLWPSVVGRLDRWLSRPGLGRRQARGATLRNGLVVAALLAWGVMLHLVLLPLAGHHVLQFQAAAHATLTVWIGPHWPLLTPWMALLLVQTAIGWAAGGWLGRRWPA